MVERAEMIEKAHRRDCDKPINEQHQPPCDLLRNHMDFEGRILSDLHDIKVDQAASKDQQRELSMRLDKMVEEQRKMLEIIEAWNNAKGFISTWRTISQLVFWTTAFSAAVAALWAAVKYGLKS